MARSIAIIGAPSSAGAYAPGQEKAPAAFRRHGLVESLQRTGALVRDLGDTELFRWRPDRARPKAMNLDAVRRAAESVARHVAASMKTDETALVLGGDCTVELGTVAGAQQDGASVGLIYIDFDTTSTRPKRAMAHWTGLSPPICLTCLAPRRNSPAWEPARPCCVPPNCSTLDRTPPK